MKSLAFMIVFVVAFSASSSFAAKTKKIVSLQRQLPGKRLLIQTPKNLDSVNCEIRNGHLVGLPWVCASGKCGSTQDSCETE